MKRVTTLGGYTVCSRLSCVML